VAEKKTPKTEAAPKSEGGTHQTTPSRQAKKCREKDCKHAYRAKGYCVKHYRLWRQGTLGKKQRYKICSKEGCRKPMVRWGLCQEHYKPAPAADAGSAPAPAAG
jgi:hypothetical protein